MMSSETEEDWIELLDRKQWSRLLYTNPVCFLSTSASASVPAKDDDDDKEAEEEEEEDHATVPPSSSASMIISKSNLSRNVMVLSWLTATNNAGGFMFSINKRRYSASRIMLEEEENSRIFCLSVPTRDSEELVCQVGSVSGVWGISKFPDDHHQQHHQLDWNDAGVRGSRDEDEVEGLVQRETETRSSSRSHKRNKKQGPRFPRGIPGLHAVALGSSSQEPVALEQAEFEVEEKGASSGSAASFPSPLRLLFAIQGTVAHLQCRLIQHHEHMIDGDHWLALAQVERAWVRSDYWDASKNLFCPVTLKSMQSPYLTFFGSQTFGYVVTKETLRRLERGSCTSSATSTDGDKSET